MNDFKGIKFGEEFGNRYGQPTPAFFPGSLEDALADACNKPVSERKMLAVYLHHDSSVLTNVFCTQVCVILYQTAKRINLNILD